MSGYEVLQSELDHWRNIVLVEDHLRRLENRDLVKKLVASTPEDPIFT